jgi:hypothetical protein
LSPDLTTETDSWPDYKNGELQEIASITVLGESPVNPNLVYSGTDDGHVHVTADGGGTWTEVTENFPGLPGPRWVSRIVASRFDESTAYAAFDGHRNDDFAPYVFMTADAGKSWTSIASDLPADGPVRVIREDVKNPNLLFVGTEFAAFVSFDRGDHWLRLINGMPTVAVADLVVHPRDGHLIAGTHGRSVYVMDIAPLQEMTAAILEKDLHLFTVPDASAFRYRVHSDDQFLGEKRFIAENPPFGATISYYMSEAMGVEGEDESEEEKATLVVTDGAGVVVRELEGSMESGIQRVQWDLRYTPPEREEEADSFQGPLEGPLVEPGVYRVSLEAGEHQVSTSLTVLEDPELDITEGDRQRRWQVVERLVPLQADTYRKGKQSQSIKEQLEELNESLAEQEDISDELKESVKGIAEELEILAHEMDRTATEVTQLYRAVENSPYVPTQTQIHLLEEMEARHHDQSSELDELTETKIPELERQLNQNRVPRIRLEQKE